LLDVETGETLTFSSSTQGGQQGVRELAAQIKLMRNMRAGAVPIVELKSVPMPTKFGPKPRPQFKICGWKVRDDGGDQTKMIAGANSNGGVAEVNAFDDTIPW
jgi:hypothetical protein